MPPDATTLRRMVYRTLLDTGRPPLLREIGDSFGDTAEAVRDWVAALRIGKTILPHPQTGEIWMAGPFASAPTDYRVIGARTTWFANCGWDMLGIPMIARQKVRIETQCHDCGEPITLQTGPDDAPDVDGVVHFLVPARRWYADIGYT